MGFLISVATDTPKDTPYKRWLPPEVVGWQFVSKFSPGNAYGAYSQTQGTSGHVNEPSHMLGSTVGAFKSTANSGQSFRQRLDDIEIGKTI
jgi:hypothetical protein